MGQTIQISNSIEDDQVLMVSTDRSLSGQDGEAYTGPVSAAAVNTFPARLAIRIFEAESSIDHVYVMSNTVSIRRRGGWDVESKEKALETISEFFRFYRDGEQADPLAEEPVEFEEQPLEVVETGP